MYLFVGCILEYPSHVLVATFHLSPIKTCLVTVTKISNMQLLDFIASIETVQLLQIVQILFL